MDISAESLTHWIHVPPTPVTYPLPIPPTQPEGSLRTLSLGFPASVGYLRPVLSRASAHISSPLSHALPWPPFTQADFLPTCHLRDARFLLLQHPPLRSVRVLFKFPEPSQLGSVCMVTLPTSPIFALHPSQTNGHSTKSSGSAVVCPTLRH